ncbi:sugar phosphate isomerase/epimerase family protein [Roseibium sp. M-1]
MTRSTKDFSPRHCLDRFSFNTATIGNNQEQPLHDWEIAQLTDACAEKGFSAITLWRNDLRGGVRKVVDAVNAAGLKVSGLCRSPFLIGPLASDRELTDQEFRASIENAASIGAPSLTVCVGGVITGTKGMSYSFSVLEEQLSTAAEFASEMGIRLALEPLHPMYAGSRSCIVTTQDAISLIAKIDHHALSLAIDVYHVWWDQKLAQSITGIAPEKIEAFHLCDWLPDTRDMLLDRGMMGDGVADIRNLRNILYEHGFCGYEEVEIFSSRNWWQQDPNTVLETCVDRFLSCC